MGEVVIPGFQLPQPAKENWVAELYEKHGLGKAPTLEEIEPKATQLLSNVRTALPGAELVLGRRVDTKDKEVMPIIFTPGLSGADKFGLLLMQKSTETRRAEQAAKQKTG